MLLVKIFYFIIISLPYNVNKWFHRGDLEVRIAMQKHISHAGYAAQASAPWNLCVMLLKMYTNVK